MWEWFKSVDRILRGEATQREALKQGSVPVPAGGMLLVIAMLGAVYGFCMGWYALFNRETAEWRQVIAAMLKVPALFLLTLLVTFPSLYVFNALVGSRLSVIGMLKLLVAALAVTLALLASFGPIIAFFAVSSDSYPFMVLLNVALFSVSGAMGLMFLLQTLQRLSTLDVPPGTEPAESVAAAPEVRVSGPESAPPPEDIVREVVPVHPDPIQPPRPQRPSGALERPEGQFLGQQVKTVFYCWVVVFALVGMQMGWVLRPFVGDPDQEFTWFRSRDSSFFGGVVNTLRGLVEPKR